MAVGARFELATRAINPSSPLAGERIQPDSATQPWRRARDSNPNAAHHGYLWFSGPLPYQLGLALHVVDRGEFESPTHGPIMPLLYQLSYLSNCN